MPRSPIDERSSVHVEYPRGGAHLLDDLPRWWERPDRRTWLAVGWIVTGLVAAFPVARMLSIVLDGSSLQYADYWQMLPTFTSPSGGLDVGGLFEFQNEHPVVVAKVVYWINIHLFSGSNISLGLVVVGMVLAQLGVIFKLARNAAVSQAERMIIVGVSAFLLFSLTGTWNFAKAMSGTAWLSANLFVLLAIWHRSCDRVPVAYAWASVAAISYGTGIGVWPALLVVGTHRRGLRAAWREWPAVLGATATFIWYQLHAPEERVLRTDPATIITSAADFFASTFEIQGDVAAVVGYGALLAIPVLMGFLVTRSRLGGVAGWLGVATFGYVATIMVAAARVEFIDVAGRSRYASPPALAWIGFLGLVALVVRTIVVMVDWSAVRSSGPVVSPVLAVLVVATGLVGGSFDAGQAETDRLVEFNRPYQAVGEIAFRLGLVDGGAYFTVFRSVDDITDRMISVDHFPFVDGWNRDCGLLGSHIVADEDEPSADGETSAEAPPFGLAPATAIKGSFTDRRSVRCIVVVDEQMRVVGVGAARSVSRENGSAWQSTEFVALATSGAQGYQVYVMWEDTGAVSRLGTEVAGVP